jgi:hypothetical protein
MAEQVPLIWYYYTSVFRHFTAKLPDRIRACLIDEPKAFRHRWLLPNLPDRQYLSVDEGWTIQREYLDRVEGAMGELAKRHSPAYWLHIYRRIGVNLSGEHPNKTDAMTLGHVRRHVELALRKYGDLTKHDLGDSGTTPARHILGGHFVRIGHKEFRGRIHEFQQLCEGLKARRQLIVTDFAVSDFLDIYRLEGFAYEYWFVSASLRSIGKGLHIKRDGDAWSYEKNTEIRELIKKYDQRIDRTPFSSTAFGGWFRPDSEGSAVSRIMLALYNVASQSGDEYTRRYDLEISDPFSGKWTPNFFDSDVGHYCLSTGASVHSVTLQKQNGGFARRLPFRAVGDCLACYVARKCVA